MGASDDYQRGKDYYETPLWHSICDKLFTFAGIAILLLICGIGAFLAIAAALSAEF
jgi:hypothetical protein